MPIRKDVKGAILRSARAEAKKDPTNVRRFTVECSSRRTMRRIAEYLADEWKVTAVRKEDFVLTFEIHAAFGSVLTDLRYEFPRGYVCGTMEPL